jgi:hypothetical protein
MSNRIKFVASLGLLLATLIVVTTWYRSRETTPIAAPPPSAAAGRLGAADRVANSLGAWSTPEPTALPAPLPPNEGDSTSATTSEPRAAASPVRARAARAERSAAKSKNRPTEEAPVPEPEVLPAASAEPVASAAPTTPPPVPPAPVGMLVGHLRNRVGSSLRLVRITYVLDGAVVFSEEGDKLAQSRDLDVLNRKTSPGEHAISVIAEFQGNGRGVFSYFDTYRYKAQSSNRFIVREAATTDLTVMLLEKSGPMTSFENRLAVAFRVN